MTEPSVGPTLPGAASPPRQGLYDPAQEHDACGVAFVVDVQGRAGHDIVRHGLTALRNLDHRGAAGCDPETGDGAGILVQIPDAFLRAEVDFPLPPAGAYAVGLAFLPLLAGTRDAAIRAVSRIARQERLTIAGWRVVPVDREAIGVVARSVEPVIRQLFLTAPDGAAGMDLERRAYRVRKRVEHETELYFPSLSTRTLVYKGMLTTAQLGEYFPDLNDDRFCSALALVHSRFSTNTFPSWPLAHPYRFIAHNGEINTVRGNRNWMRARESQLASEALAGPGGLAQLFPICGDLASDSASFDEVLELLHLAGRT
ncbi:MAG TPA: glutamate synthase subunit alpha, partial [Mycobacteriales bacterium]|nr:glutamate synthase subunit alpha [Mycobacteriales bacterium]